MKATYFIIIQDFDNIHYALERHSGEHKRLATFPLKEARKSAERLQEKFPEKVKSYKFYKLRGIK